MASEISSHPAGDMQHLGKYRECNRPAAFAGGPGIKEPNTMVRVTGQFSWIMEKGWML